MREQVLKWGNNCCWTKISSSSTSSTLIMPTMAPSWPCKWLSITIMLLKKWFEPRSNIPWFKKIIWVIGVLRRTVVGGCRFDNLFGSHLQSQVIVLVSWKFKNPGERFDRSIDRVAVGKQVMWLAVKTCAEIGYANRWVVRWIINNVFLFPVE